MTAWRGRLADVLLARATVRLRRDHPDWARALRAESAYVPDAARLRWALGAWLASGRTPEALSGMAYACALTAGVLLMTGYQWVRDEGPVTVALACTLTAALVLLRPRRVVLPVACIGLVVFAVNLFGTLTGVRPAYETHVHTVTHDLRWALMALPSAAVAFIVRWAGGRGTRRATSPCCRQARTGR